MLFGSSFHPGICPQGGSGESCEPGEGPGGATESHRSPGYLGQVVGSGWKFLHLRNPATLNLGEVNTSSFTRGIITKEGGTRFVRHFGTFPIVFIPCDWPCSTSLSSGHPHDPVGVGHCLGQRHHADK